MIRNIAGNELKQLITEFDERSKKLIEILSNAKEYKGHQIDRPRLDFSLDDFEVKRSINDIEATIKMIKKLI